MPQHEAVPAARPQRRGGAQATEPLLAENLASPWVLQSHAFISSGPLTVRFLRMLVCLETSWFDRSSAILCPSTSRSFPDP